MLNENLKILRKNKGYSQEQLAVRLNVVRQTVSKWEKGLSVPDAQMLVDIAEVFNVSVRELLGNDIEQETKADTLEIIGIILFVVFICSIFDEWNQIWYELGQNIYKLTH